MQKKKIINALIYLFIFGKVHIPPQITIRLTMPQTFNLDNGPPNNQKLSMFPQ
jgi:hypothetical protein